MGRLDKNNRKFLAEILYGFIQSYMKVADVHFQAGLVPQNASREFAQALRSWANQYLVNL